MSDDPSGQQVALLDTSGLTCPEPVMLLHSEIAKLDCGGKIRVVATDPSTRRDFPKFCAYLGHELLEQQIAKPPYHYVIAKRS